MRRAGAGLGRLRPRLPRFVTLLAGGGALAPGAPEVMVGVTSGGSAGSVGRVPGGGAFSWRDPDRVVSRSSAAGRFRVAGAGAGPVCAGCRSSWRRAGSAAGGGPRRLGGQEAGTSWWWWSGTACGGGPGSGVPGARLRLAAAPVEYGRGRLGRGAARPRCSGDSGSVRCGCCRVPASCCRCGSCRAVGAVWRWWACWARRPAGGAAVASRGRPGRLRVDRDRLLLRAGSQTSVWRAAGCWPCGLSGRDRSVPGRCRRRGGSCGSWRGGAGRRVVSGLIRR